MWDGKGKMSLYMCLEEKDFVMKGSKLLSAIMINFVVVWVILHIVWFTFSNGSSVFKW